MEPNGQRQTCGPCVTPASWPGGAATPKQPQLSAPCRPVATHCSGPLKRQRESWPASHRAQPGQTTSGSRCNCSLLWHASTAGAQPLRVRAVLLLRGSPQATAHCSAGELPIMQEGRYRSESPACRCPVPCSCCPCLMMGRHSSSTGWGTAHRRAWTRSSLRPTRGQPRRGQRQRSDQPRLQVGDLSSGSSCQILRVLLVCCILQHVQALRGHDSQAVAPACCRAQAQIRGSQEGQEAPSQQPSHTGARAGAAQQTTAQTRSLSTGLGCKGVTDQLKASHRQHSLHDLAEEHINLQQRQTSSCGPHNGCGSLQRALHYCRHRMEDNSMHLIRSALCTQGEANFIPWPAAWPHAASHLHTQLHAVHCTCSWCVPQHMRPTCMQHLVHDSGPALIACQAAWLHAVRQRAHTHTSQLCRLHGGMQIRSSPPRPGSWSRTSTLSWTQLHSACWLGTAIRGSQRCWRTWRMPALLRHSNSVMPRWAQPCCATRVHGSPPACLEQTVLPRWVRPSMTSHAASWLQLHAWRLECEPALQAQPVSARTACQAGSQRVAWEQTAFC